jgi:hypothetical protein
MPARAARHGFPCDALHGVTGQIGAQSRELAVGAAPRGTALVIGHT